MKIESIKAYNSAQDTLAQPICARLEKQIRRGLPEAEGRIWHAHPVWFLTDNPIVGYGRLKDCVRLMFWSGQGFATPGLTAEGKFKAATLRLTDAGQIDTDRLALWLAEARDIQWDYENVVKRKGRLERLH